MTTPSSCGHDAHAGDRVVLVHRAGLREPLAALLTAEVGPFEQLRRQDDVRALRRRLAHVLLHALDVRRARTGQRTLHGRDGDPASCHGAPPIGCCCVMQ